MICGNDSRDFNFTVLIVMVNVVVRGTKELTWSKR